MSVFTPIITETKTFAAWAEKKLEAVFKKAPTLAHIADVVLGYVGPILEEVVSREAGEEAGALVGDVVTEVQSDLIIVGGLIYDIGAAPTVAAKIQAMQNDLNGLLMAGHIKDQKNVSAITYVIRELGALFTAISQKKLEVPEPPPAAAV